MFKHIYKIKSGILSGSDVTHDLYIVIWGNQRFNPRLHRDFLFDYYDYTTIKNLMRKTFK